MTPKSPIPHKSILAHAQHTLWILILRDESKFASAFRNPQTLRHIQNLWPIDEQCVTAGKSSVENTRTSENEHISEQWAIITGPLSIHRHNYASMCHFHVKNFQYYTTCIMLFKLAISLLPLACNGCQHMKWLSIITEPLKYIDTVIAQYREYTGG